MLEVGKGQWYKCFGILEVDEIKKNEEWNKLSVVSIQWRIRDILQSKPNFKNLFEALNSREVPIIRYGVGIIYWTAKQYKETCQRN